MAGPTSETSCDHLARWVSLRSTHPTSWRPRIARMGRAQRNPSSGRDSTLPGTALNRVGCLAAVVVQAATPPGDRQNSRGHRALKRFRALRPPLRHLSPYRASPLEGSIEGVEDDCIAGCHGYADRGARRAVAARSLGAVTRHPGGCTTGGRRSTRADDASHLPVILLIFAALGCPGEDVVVSADDTGTEQDDGGASDAFGWLPDRGSDLAQ
jgi:hypothetical protein